MVDSTFQRLMPHRHPGLGPLDEYLQEPSIRERLAACELAREYPRDVLDGLRARGLADLLVPEHASTPQLSALAALTARHNGSLAVTVGVNGLGLLPVYIAGTADQWADVTGRLHAGQFACLMLSELAHGSNLLRNEASARPEGDGYVLAGGKQLINGGSEHDIVLAFLRTATSDRSPLRDFTLFLVGRDDTVEPAMRWRTLPVPAADVSSVRFAGTRVPATAVIGGVGQGFAVVQKTLVISHGGVAAFASGTASAAAELAVGYARERDVYGSPIVELGAVSEHLMRLLALDLVVAAAAVKASLATNRLGANAGYLTAAAKYICCRLAEAAVAEGRQVLGARALVEDGGYARLVRDVLVFGTFDGTSHIMLDLLAEHSTRFGAERQASTWDLTRELYALPPRSVRAATSQPWRPYTHGPAARCADLATVVVSPFVDELAELARVLSRLIGAARAAGRWSTDQALRFQAAAALAEIEALLATCELALPDGRAALGLTPAAVDDAVTAYALGWRGGRVAARLGELAHLVGTDEAQAALRGLPRLGPPATARRELYERLTAESALVVTGELVKLGHHV